MAKERKDTLGIGVQSGMLDALGVQMYENIAQSIVEFIANAYDADAENVSISMPFTEIAKSRDETRAVAKANGADLRQGVFTPLSSDLKITIKDDGHGMTWQELESKFLPISRNRRDDPKTRDWSEGKKRPVMGRKGLGKLAGFGAAKTVTIRSKRKNEAYATTIAMDYDQFQSVTDVGQIKIPAKYEDGLSLEEQGTTVTLSNLRCDAMKRTEDALLKTLRKNFARLGEEFKLFLNGTTRIEEKPVDYEFTWPPEEQRTEDGLAPIEVTLEGTEGFTVYAAVRFRARGASDDKMDRGHVAASDRGAWIYCKKRLAAGPTLLDLPTGMHNFHSQSYIDCIVLADFLDELPVDLISTNRRGLKSDNDMVQAFIVQITELMRVAIREHGKYRDGIAPNILQGDDKGRETLALVQQLPTKQRRPANLLLETIAAREGVESEAFRQFAPVLIKAVNSAEVLIELIKSGNNPSSLNSMISQLHELAEVERSDVLKLYRARRSAIAGLQKLEERSHTKGPAYEKELHTLLKANPWLIRPEFSNYITSDAPLGNVAKKIDEKLGIDTKAPEGDATRPDLVFAAVDQNRANEILIVELKSPDPANALNFDHLRQLKRYMKKVEDMMTNDLPNAHPIVRGFLIGTMAEASSKAETVVELREAVKEAGVTAKWKVLPLTQLLQDAKAIHVDVIEALEAEEASE